MAGRMTRIWDPAVRLFHWSLAVSVLTAWATGDEIKSVHEPVGYLVMGLVAFRIIWGFVGSHYARFGQFVPSPTTFVAYMASVIKGDERRYLGHNPAGAMMIVTLLLFLSAIAVTGWLQTTDAWFGSEALEDIHGLLANALLVFIVLHVGGVVLSSLRHRENLVRAMLTGLKRPAAHSDVV